MLTDEAFLRGKDMGAKDIRCKRRITRFSKKESVFGYVFIMPAILGFLCWCLIPMIMSILLSFSDWNVLTDAKFVGFENYKKLFTDDPFFYDSLIATFKYAIGSTIVTSIYAFLLALFLNCKLPGKAIFRTIYYMPTMVPVVANNVLWGWLYNPEFGLFNAILNWFGLPGSMFLRGENTVIPSLIFMTAWGCGNTMVIYLAGLQGIPSTLLEAIEIDGGNYWQKLKNVTIPLMSPIIFFNGLMGLISSFQVFSQAYMLTNGGPNNKSLFLNFLLYRTAFQENKMGYACALGWIMFLIMMIFTACVFIFFGKRVYYEGGNQQ